MDGVVSADQTAPSHSSAALVGRLLHGTALEWLDA